MLPAGIQCKPSVTARAAALEGSAMPLCLLHLTLLMFMQGRKAPGAPLTQNVLAAKQLTKRVDVVASDSEADSASGLTEPQVCCIRHSAANSGLNVAHQICSIVAGKEAAYQQE